MTSYRNEQLADVVRMVVGRYALDVPPSIAMLASVTDVKLSPDCLYADVMISAIEGAEGAVRFLKKERMREIKKTLSKEFRAHSIPLIRLRSDERGKQAHELETLIDRL